MRRTAGVAIVALLAAGCTTASSGGHTATGLTADQIYERNLAANPFVGDPLTGEWEGARSLHFANDHYRLIWEVNEDVDEVYVLRVGRKRQLGGTIYDLPRPLVD